MPRKVTSFTLTLTALELELVQRAISQLDFWDPEQLAASFGGSDGAALTRARKKLREAGPSGDPLQPSPAELRGLAECIRPLVAVELESGTEGAFCQGRDARRDYPLAEAGFRYLDRLIEHHQKG